MNLMHEVERDVWIVLLVAGAALAILVLSGFFGLSAAMMRGLVQP